MALDPLLIFDYKMTSTKTLSTILEKLEKDEKSDPEEIEGIKLIINERMLTHIITDGTTT